MLTNVLAFPLYVDINSTWNQDNSRDKLIWLEGLMLDIRHSLNGWSQINGLHFTACFITERYLRDDTRKYQFIFSTLKLGIESPTELWNLKWYATIGMKM